jgi:Mg/Co/Ni transporter MgtE
MTYSVQNGLIPASVLAGEPTELAKALAGYRPADAAEALNSLDRSVAARVLEAMPVSAAVQILNEPHLDV